MVLPVLEFPTETYEQANPWVRAMNEARQQATFAQQQQLFPERLKLMQAQAAREESLANQPFGGQFAPGVAGQIQGLESIRQHYGDDSPQYQLAKKAYETDLAQKAARTSYFGSNTALKYLPQEAKETLLADKAFREGQTDLGQALLAARQKRTSDAKTRAQAAGAQQLLEEAQKVNLQPLEEYSGLLGKSKAGVEAVKGMLGLQVPKDYLEYNNFKKFMVPQMADTIRQALQTSVMPTYVREMIKPMVDPTSSLFDNPQTVRARWKIFLDWLKDYNRQKTNIITKGIPAAPPAAPPAVPEGGINQVPRGTQLNDPLGIR